LRAGNLELRVLLLMHNNLGNKTAAAFGDLLESSHTLKELDLSWNQIKVRGFSEVLATEGGMAEGMGVVACLASPH
jgi:Ran GTPase-activating protein (RanGAP) involved in mRNA processing and transport